MPKEKEPEPDTTGQIPLWFLTYSDVITLLMTFFILLLTFATSEPEKFERMQVAMFSGGGATGLAGEPQGALDKDAVVMRMRPNAGRLTTRGSEMPPEYADPTRRSLAKGLSSLDEPPEFDPLENHRVLSPISMFLTDTEITAIGQQRLHMVAQQMKKGPYGVVFEVASDAEAKHMLDLAQHLVEVEGILPGRIGISVAPMAVKRSDTLSVRIVCHAKEGQ